MSYRAHFPYRTPQGFVDEAARFPFDYRQVGNNPANYLPNYQLANQILKLDEDAPFLWRSISWACPDYLQLQFFLSGSLAMRIRDPLGNYLDNDFVPLLNRAQGYYVWQPWTQGPPTGPLWTAPSAGGMGVPFADEIYCPASSTIELDLLWVGVFGNDFTLNDIGRFLARGVKRRPLSDCSDDERRYYAIGGTA